MKHLILIISVLLFLSCEKNNLNPCKDISCLELKCPIINCNNIKDSITSLFDPLPILNPNDFVNDFAVKPNDAHKFALRILEDSIERLVIYDNESLILDKQLSNSLNWTIRWGSTNKLLTIIEDKIWIINENGDSLKRLTNSLTNGERAADWSPDGKWIVYNFWNIDSIGTYRINIE